MKRLLGIAGAIVLLAAVSLATTADCDGVLPEQAYQMLFDNPNAYIIDVRSPAEYYWIGHPEMNLADDPASGILEGRVFHIPYKFWVYDHTTRTFHMPINKFFTREVAETFPAGATLIFMCRSGPQLRLPALPARPRELPGEGLREDRHLHDVQPGRGLRGRPRPDYPPPDAERRLEEPRPALPGRGQGDMERRPRCR